MSGRIPADVTATTPGTFWTPWKNLLAKLPGTFSGISPRKRVYSRNQRVSNIEARPGLHQMQEASREQAAKREGHYRQYNLECHETVTEIPTPDRECRLTLLYR